MPDANPVLTMTNAVILYGADGPFAVPMICNNIQVAYLATP
jgi:hypothetical protein